jgi:hypothetical protein
MALDLLANGGPVSAARDLVERLARSRAQEDATGEELLERHERLCHDGRVVPVHERRDAGPYRQPRDRLPDRAEPHPGVARLALGPPRREVIGAADAVEAGFGGSLSLGQRFGGRGHLV